MDKYKDLLLQSPLPPPPPHPGTFTPSSHGEGTGGPALAFVDYGIASILFLSLVPILGSGWGTKWRYFSSDSRWDLNLSSHYLQLSALIAMPHSHIPIHRHIYAFIYIYIYVCVCVFIATHSYS